MEKLVAFLEEHQFTIEKGIVGRPTAFKAVYDSKKPGPTIAYLSNMMPSRSRTWMRS